MAELAERLAPHAGVETVARRGELVRLRSDPDPLAAADSARPTFADHRIHLPERPDAPAPVSHYAQFPQQRTHVVSDAYFGALGLRLLRGRLFAPDDVAGSAPAAVVSRELARHLWGDGSPLGRRLRLGPEGALLTVVGEVSDRHDPVFGPRGLRTSAHPELYLSERQAHGADELLVRARGDAGAAASLAATVQQAARQLAPGEPVSRPETLAERHAVVTTVIRALGAIFVSFAGCALVLALIGIWGVIAHGVAERRREIGIHLTLGATPADVGRAAARRGVRLTTIGLLLGAAGAWALAQLMRGILAGIAPLHPATFALAAALFAGVALLASWLPARRATRVHPMETLREL